MTRCSRTNLAQPDDSFFVLFAHEPMGPRVLTNPIPSWRSTNWTMCRAYWQLLDTCRTTLGGFVYPMIHTEFSTTENMHVPRRIQYVGASSLSWSTGLPPWLWLSQILAVAPWFPIFLQVPLVRF